MNLRKLLCDYSENPIMTKTGNGGGFSIYKVKINTLLLNNHRYLVAMVEQDAHPFGREVPLKMLRWKVFQAISHDEGDHCRSHNYRPKMVMPYTTVIHIHTKDAEYTRYRAPGVRGFIDLLGDTEYPERGTIATAMETFNTVVILD